LLTQEIRYTVLNGSDMSALASRWHNSVLKPWTAKFGPPPLWDPNWDPVEKTVAKPSALSSRRDLSRVVILFDVIVTA
jgi:hypothetical protein